MAKLTDYLPMNLEGKRTIQPYDKGPSLFEGIAKLGSTILSAQAGADATNAQKAAAARQARQDALEASDRGAKNLAADAILQAGTAQDRIDNPPPPTTTPYQQTLIPPISNAIPGQEPRVPITQGEIEELQGAQTKGNEIGQQAAQWQRGVAQGRISAPQYELMLESSLREGFRAFPQSKYVMLEEIKKYGIDHPIMSEYRRASAELDREASAQSTREENAIDWAVTKGGLDPRTPRDTLITSGYRGQADEAALSRDRATYKFNVEKAANDKTRLDSINAANDDAVGKYVHGKLAVAFGSALDNFNTVIQDNSIPEKDRLKAASDFINVFRPKAYELIDNNLLIAVNQHGMSQKTADAERTRLRAQVDDIFTQFSADNPLNVIQTNGKILQTMKDSFQLDLQDAMPVYTQFKEAFGSADAVQSLVEHIASDPGLSSVFTRELKGFQGLAQGDQTIRLKNLIAFMSDRNTSLRDYSPQESGQILKDTSNMLSRGLYAQAQRGDSRSQQTVLSALGKVANASVDLNQGSSTKSLINAVNFLGNNAAYTTLRRLDKDHKEFGGLVADEMRVGVGKALISLMQQRTSDPYFKWAINDKSHKFEIVATGRPQARASSAYIVGGLSPAPGVVSQPTAIPSTELRATVAAMNKAVSFLMPTTDFEDRPALKGASYEEKWKFYTRGELPETAQPKDGQSGRERISRLQDFWANVKVDWAGVPDVNVAGEVNRTTGQGSGVQVNPDGSRTATNLAGKPITIPDIPSITSKHADNPIFKTLVSMADKYNIPREVAIRLGFVETGGKFNNPVNLETGAWGPVQVTNSVNSIAQELFGKNVPALSAAQSIEVGMKYLKQLHDKYGDWIEAAHSYIGRGNSDGNILSRDYAELVGGQ